MLSSLLVVVGPTGSGKSTLALRLAADFDGEIVNCDSLQLYRGFHIGTAKTPVEDRRGIPHHLLDALDPSQRYSAGEYARQARAAVADIAGRGRRPVVVGGTGFYLRALLDGLPKLPEGEDNLRVSLERREAARPGALHRLLSRLEPGAARSIHPRDVQKLIRAMEVRLLTGSPRPPRTSAEPLRGFRVLQIGLAPPRAELTEVLRQRTQDMFRRGLIEEVRALLAGGLTGEEKPFESLGYRQALACLRGLITREQAVESTEIETRQYAKRQLTWFRRDARVQWLEGFGSDPQVVERAAVRLRAFLSG